MQRRAAHARPIRSRPFERAEAPSSRQHARLTSRASGRPSARAVAAERASDLPRVLAAGASAVFPGLGQLVNRRPRLAAWFGVPTLVAALVGALLIVTESPARLLATVVSPSVMTFLLAVNALVLAVRLASVWHAFFDRRHTTPPGRVGMLALAALSVAVVLPHAFANAWGTSAAASFSKIFATSGAGPGKQAAAIDPGSGRINVLIVGVDSLPWRGETLTDSLMVASLDPVSKTASLLSLPRDIVDVPLGNGDVYAAKINSIMSYAAARKDRFPQGGMRALEDAVGTMLGIPIHYYARIDFVGFVALVDSIGGVDVNVKKGFTDPVYDGYGFPGYSPNSAPPGWTVTAGPHHFDGYEALAYARSRYAIGESDFTRAGRQQEILLAIRARLLSNGALLTQLPQLFSALGNLVKTDIPVDRLPDFAAIVDEMGPSSISRRVLEHPLVVGANDPRLGSVQRPDLPAIRAMVAAFFPPPGSAPTGSAGPSRAP